MGLLGSLIGTVVNVAVLPVRLAVDVVTLPATADDPSRGPFDSTAQGLKNIADGLL